MTDYWTCLVNEIGLPASSMVLMEDGYAAVRPYVAGSYRAEIYGDPQGKELMLRITEEVQALAIEQVEIRAKLPQGACLGRPTLTSGPPA